MSPENDEVLLVKVAHLYYDQLLTQDAIARRLSITRWKVGRLLAVARKTGIVTITINHGHQRISALEEELISKFQLEVAVVVTSGEFSTGEVLPGLALAAADLLTHLAAKPSALGVSWGQTMDAVADALKLGWAEGIHIVQLNGALSLSSAEGSHRDPAQKLAFTGRGRCTLMPVPAIVDDPRVKVGLERDSTIKQILSIAMSTPAALFSLGSLSSESVLVQSGYLSREEVRRLMKLGAVGDILGRFVDSDGKIVDPELDARTLGISLTDLSSKKIRIAVAHGVEKKDIARAALKAHIPTHLVVDEILAQILVDAS